jgi:hypothetical protein
MRLLKDDYRVSLIKVEGNRKEGKYFTLPVVRAS